MIICGLDSIVARRWINGMVHSLLQYDTEGQMVQTSMIPMVDGGTEGFKGNARVIMPGHTACIECTLDLFPPQVLRTYPRLFFVTPLGATGGETAPRRLSFPLEFGFVP